MLLLFRSRERSVSRRMRASVCIPSPLLGLHGKFCNLSGDNEVKQISLARIRMTNLEKNSSRFPRSKQSIFLEFCPYFVGCYVEPTAKNRQFNGTVSVRDDPQGSDSHGIPVNLFIQAFERLSALKTPRLSQAEPSISPQRSLEPLTFRSRFLSILFSRIRGNPGQVESAFESLSSRVVNR